MNDQSSLSEKAKSLSKDKSIQYDLFTQFLVNESGQTAVSNTVEFWEHIPKYFFTPSTIKKLRTKEGHADPFKWEYTFKDKLYSVKIQPALIEDKKHSGKYMAYFPSVTEELVEEALKKIFTDQNFGQHNAKKKESWVRFTLSMIHKELKNKGRERNRSQIKHAIDVMSSCVITLYEESEEIWKGSILQDLVTVGRKEYLADTDAHHVARLPLFVSLAINNIGYRQYNYERLMGCSGQLARWIYKHLVHHYIHANHINDYHISYENMVKSSALLQQSTIARNRAKIFEALDELKESSVIREYEETPKRDGRKIISAVYTLRPTHVFVSEQKAANKRRKDDKEKLNITEQQTTLLSGSSGYDRKLAKS